jgi:hypothetical protein
MKFAEENRAWPLKALGNKGAKRCEFLKSRFAGHFFQSQNVARFEQRDNNRAIVRREIS